MKIAPDIRETRKAAHLARIEAKKTDDPENPKYPALYASQPAEIRKGNEQRVQRRAIAEAQRALQIAMGLDAQGSVEVFSGGQIEAAVGIGTDASGQGSAA